MTTRVIGAQDLNAKNSALDNVIWSALTTHQAALALGGPIARRFPAAYTPFAATPDYSAASFRALAQLFVPDEPIALFTVGDVQPTAEFAVLGRRDMVQMVGPTLPSSDRNPLIIPLGAADADEMLAIAEETKPGPFGNRTRELGQFLGIRVKGRLAAMAGERMHLTGFTEVSGVCVRPEYRGRGYARDLVIAIMAGIAARGETPFLHAYSDNLSAIALYEKIGFRHRSAIRLTRLQLAT